MLLLIIGSVATGVEKQVENHEDSPPLDENGEPTSSDGMLDADGLPVAHFDTPMDEYNENHMEDEFTEYADPYDPAAHAREEFQKMDADNDGKAEIGEIINFVRKEFYAPEEIHEEPAEQEKKVQDDAKQYLAELDTNKDGALDLDELTEHYSGDMSEVYDELAAAADNDVANTVSMDPGAEAEHADQQDDEIHEGLSETEQGVVAKDAPVS